jgi:hypothetical protein
VKPAFGAPSRRRSFSGRFSGIEHVQAPSRNYLQKSLLTTDGDQTRSMVDRALTTWEEHARDRAAWWPLDIPTYDGDPSVGHPSVVFAPQGWNGSRYWMAFTPFPDGKRENPSIVVSQDGVRWRVPDGARNPVVSAEEVRRAGFSCNSDPELVLTADGQMLLYYRPFSRRNEAIFCKRSEDGVQWSSAQMVLSSRAVRYPAQLLSPAVDVGTDGVLTMWTVNGLTLGRRVVERRTSLDGLQWSPPERCAVPRGVNPWHIDVAPAGGQYHMLVSDRTRLFYWTSQDGRTWTGSRRKAVGRSGTGHDARGHYRSTFVATWSALPRWDVWITGTDGSGRNLFFDAWRIGLLRNVDLAADGPEEAGWDLRPEWRWRWQHLRGQSLERVLIGTSRLRRTVDRLMTHGRAMP